MKTLIENSIEFVAPMRHELNKLFSGDEKVHVHRLRRLQSRRVIVKFKYTEDGVENSKSLSITFPSVTTEEGLKTEILNLINADLAQA